MEPIEAVKTALRNWAPRMAEMFFGPTEKLKAIYKSEDGTPQTAIDREGAKMLMSEALRLLPGCAFKDEESHVINGTSGVELVTDNADGSRNIGRLRVPQTVSGASLFYRGELIGAAIANPFEDILVWGQKDLGVFRSKLTLAKGRKENAEQLHLSAHGRPASQRFMGIDSYYPPTVAAHKTTFCGQAASFAWNMCSYGSNIYYTQLLLEGRIDFQFTDCIGGPQDILPAMALVPLLGGEVVNLEGEFPKRDEKRLIIATNGEFTQDLLKAAQRSYPGWFLGFK